MTKVSSQFEIGATVRGPARRQLLAAALLGLFAHCAVAAAADADAAARAETCSRELGNANTAMARFAETLETMVNESQLPNSIRQVIHDEANRILDMIEDFGQQLRAKQPAALAKDLVEIRRRSNRMALDIYLHTFDMRWPQNSLGLGITVERVQQACLDRQTIQALESQTSPLEPLLTHSLKGLSLKIRKSSR